MERPSPMNLSIISSNLHVPKRECALTKEADEFEIWLVLKLLERTTMLMQGMVDFSSTIPMHKHLDFNSS